MGFYEAHQGFPGIVNTKPGKKLKIMQAHRACTKNVQPELMLKYPIRLEAKKYQARSSTTSNIFPRLSHPLI